MRTVTRPRIFAYHGAPPGAGLLVRRFAAKVRLATIQGQLTSLHEDKVRLDGLQIALDTRRARAEAERRDVAVKTDDVRRVIEYTERTRQTLSTLRDKLIERHISKIEVATLDSFMRLMRKAGLVQDLRINPTDFTITLTGPDGEPLPAGRLSAGERQLLAVALLWGLARVAGNRLPTVIDTPIGRLDSDHRERIVDRYFPNAGSQVLLLSTDEEIDEDMTHRLSSSISRSYLLEHDDAKHTTVARPGYWWNVEDQDVT